MKITYCLNQYRCSNLSDIQSIIKKIQDEINSYSDSKATGKKLIFENVDAILISKLQDFLDKALSNPDLLELDNDDFIKEFYSFIGWKYHDY